MVLRIYRLVPCAQRGDPRWLEDAPVEVVVRASSPADARNVAASAELDFLETDAKPSHGVSTRFASSFLDEKLYAVREAKDTEYSTTGPKELLRCSIEL